MTELPSAFDAVYAEVAQATIRRIYFATGDLTRSEDAVQEAFLRAWMHWNRLSAEPEYAVNWVRTTAWRLAVSDWRREKVRRRIQLMDRQYESEEAPSVNVIAVREALKRLSEEDRTVVVMFYFEGFSIAEIAGALKRPVGTIKSSLFTSRATMKPALTAD